MKSQGLEITIFVKFGGNSSFTEIGLTAHFTLIVCIFQNPYRVFDWKYSFDISLNIQILNVYKMLLLFEYHTINLSVITTLVFFLAVIIQTHGCKMRQALLF